MVTWTVDREEPYSITVPPGKLPFTIKEYYGEFKLRGVAQDCPLRVREGDSIVAVDGQPLTSVEQVPDYSEFSRLITIGERVISNDASAHSKGNLMYHKDINSALFDMMDYSGVEAKYGKEFLEELAPPHRKTGNQIFSEAWNTLSNYDFGEDDDRDCDDSEAKHDVCASCGKKADSTTKLKKCTGCYLVQYCGVACQKSAWRSHKKECRKMKR